MFNKSEIVQKATKRAESKYRLWPLDGIENPIDYRITKGMGVNLISYNQDTLQMRISFVDGVKWILENFGKKETDWIEESNQRFKLIDVRTNNDFFNNCTNKWKRVGFIVGIKWFFKIK